MLADVGNAISALGYLGLMLLILFARKTGLAKRLLLSAALVSFVTHAIYAASQWVVTSHMLVMGAESVRSLIWVLFITSCLQSSSASLVSVIKKPINIALLAIPFASLIFSLIPYAYLPGVLVWQFMLHTVLCLEILILLETFYRQSENKRWEYKPLVIALGAAAVFDFVLYSQASMVVKLDEQLWQARGFVFAMLVPFIVIAIRRIKQWGIDIFVSREIVMHSSLIMVAGIYLLFMALAGYAIKFVGGSWSTVLQVVFSVLALMILATVMMSNQFRSKVKVFITKHFFANQFDYREEWLKLTQALDDPNNGENIYNVAITCLSKATSCDTGALLKLQGSNRLEVVSQQPSQLNEDELRLVAEFLPFLQKTHWVVDVEQLRVRPFDYEGLKLSQALLNQCQFQLVIPIIQQESLWGVAVLSDTESHRLDLNWELRDYLKVVTAQIASSIFQIEASKELAENAQFAAFSRMSAFVVHDLKNVLAQIDLILANATQHKHNPEFIEDTFETLQHTKTRMEKMLRQLTDKDSSKEEKLKTFSLVQLIEEVIDRRCQSFSPKPQSKCSLDVQLKLDADKLSNVLYHLISNAQQATNDNGEVLVITRESHLSNCICIEIQDNGCGMSADFIHNRLFKPFDTTKGNAGMGIGAYDAKHYIEKLGGRMQVVSEEGQGTTFTLHLPY